MRLSELLFKYNNNATLQNVLELAKKAAKNLVNVEEYTNTYRIEPTFMFYQHIGATKTTLVLDKKLNILSEDCGCLEHYRKHECMHTIGLYAIAVMIINPKLYESEYACYEQMIIANNHNRIMNKLSVDLKSSNAYFGLIHLIPVIEASGNTYTLSLKVGADKDYVVKDISNFIYMTENDKEFSYGQKLTFVHSYECFDDISKEFYSFLTNICGDTDTKTITIRKSHLLKILEIYQGNSICYNDDANTKPTSRNIVKTTAAELVLNSQKLFINRPGNSKVFVCGVNSAYFIDNENIYTYSYKSRLEGKLFESLFKVGGGLIIDVNSEDFIANLLPIIKNNVEIQDDFYEKYPIPKIQINSFFTYANGVIYLQETVKCEKGDENSPYLEQIKKNYYDVLSNLKFFRNNQNVFNIANIENQYAFLTSDLTCLKAFGQVFFDESIKNVKTKKSGKTSISVSYDVGLLDFKFENSLLTIEEIKAMLQAYHQKKHFIKLKDNTIIEIDDEEAKKIDDFLEDFNVSLKDLNKKITKPMNYLLKLINLVDKNVNYDNKVYEMIKTIQNFKRSSYMPKDEFVGFLREYQLEGFKWLKTLSSFGFGGILADDMGLGKTLEIISFIGSDDVSKPSLIVCPMSLVYNWENECNKWGIKYPIKLILGSAEERNDLINNIDNNLKEIYITSYDSLRRDVTLYKAKFRFIIADEAQFIKNQFAQKSEAIKSLSSDMNFALTGTPIENGLADLWSIFDYLMPGYLSNYTHFKSRYEALIMHEDQEALDMLKKRVSPFILRRTKKDVLNDLPDKIENYYYCKMDAKQHEIYRAFVEKIKQDIKENSGNNILALLTRLRQVCITPELIYQEEFANTKIDMAIDLIKSSIDANHRILVFSQFAQSFPILSRQLEQSNIKHYILDGSTKAKTRMEMVDEFNKNEDVKVFIISLKAGGTGLNLVGADTVIHLDPWWNSSAELQATDRAYRIGQTKDVYVIKLICKDTIEEKVVKLQQVKKELADSIVHSDEKPVKLTKQDIMDLLD